MKYFFGCGIAFLITGFLWTSCRDKTNKALSEVAYDSTRSIVKNPYLDADRSPMDMSWCPAKIPIERMQGNDTQKLVARVIYSRPHKKNREIFGTGKGNLCVYGKPWRLGANEATEIDFFENVNIAGENITKGKYVIYCIPHASSWTIILNSNLYTWGLHIDEKRDIFRTEIPVSQQSPSVEDFTMLFEETPTGADLLMTWDNVKAVLPITFIK